MKLRALEYSDLLFVHELNNEYSIWLIGLKNLMNP